MHLTLPPLERHSVEFHFAPIVYMLEGMIGVNCFHIEKSLERNALGLDWPIPPLYASGIRYREDPGGEENWGDVYYCLALGFADCDRLIIWRCAELRVAGIWAVPVIKWQHIPYHIAKKLYPGTDIPADGLWLVHCLVRLPLGTCTPWSYTGPDGCEYEDPSKLLGMGGDFTSQV